MKLEIKQMATPPAFSILMPVYNPRSVWLRGAIESVCHQIYPNWELCIVDDASTDPNVIQDLKEMSEKDPRISIQLRTKNGNISAASNAALSMAQGEWVVFMDHDDELKEDALFWLARAIGTNDKASIIYSDEDKIGENGVRQDPHFKTEWNPALLLSYNYFCHLLAIRKDLVNQVAGFREGFEGAQDYDLILRCMEKIDTSAVVHIPRILYHWRMHPQSTASGVDIKPFAVEAGRRAITEHLKRRGTPGTVSCALGGYRVDFEITEKPKVSIIIPTHNQELLLRKCVESLIENTDYRNYQIIFVDNKTTEPRAKALLKYFCEQGLTVLSYESEFNYSRINNFAAQHAEGELILFLNNDIEILQKDWLEVMVRQISQPDVGAVGAKLLYPDGKLQHGGIILGVGGVAGHSHKNYRGDTEGYFSRCRLIQDMSAVTGACLLVKKRIFLNVNGFEENHLKVAFNDVDLCLRLKAEGKRTIWTPFACLIHHESASRGEETTLEKQERFASEIAFMKSRWGIKLQQDPYYSPNLTLANEQFDIAFPPRLENKWMI
jgi:glycosyltransferase involved in cell wall biosynthesis